MYKLLKPEKTISISKTEKILSPKVEKKAHQQVFKKINNFFIRNLLKIENMESFGILNKFFIFFICFVFLVVIQFIDKIILYFLLPLQFDFSTYNFSVQTFMANFNSQIFPVLWLFAATVIVEEIIFRLPIYLLYKYKLNLEKRTIVIILLNFLFGFYHIFGRSDLIIITEICEILLITTGGFVFSAIYIIFGGNKGKILESFIAVILLHFLFDVFILSLFGLPGYLK